MKSLILSSFFTSVLISVPLLALADSTGFPTPQVPPPPKAALPIPCQAVDGRKIMVNVTGPEIVVHHTRYAVVERGYDQDYIVVGWNNEAKPQQVIASFHGNHLHSVRVGRVYTCRQQN